MKYIFLSEQFYNDYAQYPEIEQKRFRPYVMLLIKIDCQTFALPLRSHIKHKYAYFTDVVNCCGVDYSKAIIITDEKKYIDTRVPKLRPLEFKALLGKNRVITNEFNKFLNDYKKAVKAQAKRTSYTYQYCTLQYFHKELGLN